MISVFWSEIFLIAILKTAQPDKIGNGALLKFSQSKEGHGMNSYPSAYMERIHEEIRQTPEEYLPLLLEMVHLFRQSVVLKPAEDSFRQGWREAIAGETMSVSELWSGIDG